jgi:pimeloyl-ACP methyl ester carboxylesterase
MDRSTDSWSANAHLQHAVVVATMVTAIGCSSGTPPVPISTSTPLPSPASATSPGKTPLRSSVDTAFYVPPNPLPSGSPGSIIRSEELSAPSGMRLWTVLYQSLGYSGDPIAVSGTIAAPDGIESNPLRILSWGHGTTGLIDKTAPSRQGRFSDELAIISEAISSGFTVAATDYEGLGTPGPHPYVVGVSEGRSVLDAARATRALLGRSNDDVVVLAGHSQGGHAALFAGELSADYAPELTVAGTLAFAPGGDLVLLADASTGPASSEAARQNAINVLAAWHEIYGLPLEPLLTPTGLDKAAAVVDENGPSIDWSGDLFRESPAEDPAWRPRLVENSPGHPGSQPVPPILIMQGQDDDQISVESSESVLRSYCSSGVSAAELRLIAGEDHASILWNHLDDAEAWIAGRLSGKPPVSSCGI